MVSVSVLLVKVTLSASVSAVKVPLTVMDMPSRSKVLEERVSVMSWPVDGYVNDGVLSLGIGVCQIGPQGAVFIQSGAE